MTGTQTAKSEVVGDINTHYQSKYIRFDFDLLWFFLFFLWFHFESNNNLKKQTKTNQKMIIEKNWNIKQKLLNQNIKQNKKQKTGTIDWWVKRYIMKCLVGFRACSSSLVDLSIYDIFIFKKDMNYLYAYANDYIHVCVYYLCASL